MSEAEEKVAEEMAKELAEAYSEVGVAIMVEVGVEVFELEEFSIENIPEEFWAWELGGVQDPLGQLANWLWEQIRDALSALQEAVTGFIRTVRDTILSAIDVLGTTISGLFNVLEAFIESWFNTIKGAITAIGETLEAQFPALASAISGVTQTLIGIVSSIEQLWNFVQTIPNSIIEGLSSVIENLGEGLGSAIQSLFDMLVNVFESLESGLVSIGGMVSQGFSSLANILNNLIVGVEQIGVGIASFAKSVVDELVQLGQVLKTYVGELQEFFAERYNNLAQRVTDVRTALQGFVNSLTNIWSWLTKLPENVWQVFMWAGERIGEGLVQIGQKIGPYLGNFSKWLWEQIQGMAKFFMGVISDFGKWLLSGLTNVGKLFIEGIADVIIKLFDILEELGRGQVSEIAKKALEIGGPFVRASLTPLDERLRKIIEKVLKGAPPEVWGEMASIWLAVLSGQIVARWLRQALFWTGELAHHIDIAPGVQITILGTGGAVKKTLRVNLGAILKHIGAEFVEYADIIGRAMAYGFAIWLSQPYSKLMSAMARNLFPIELPTIPVIIEVGRRFMYDEEKFKSFTEYAWKVMALYGYADNVIDWFLLSPDKMGVKVKDRFGVDRTIPLSMIYDMPSASELCRMMIHDIFATYEDFQKVIRARGFVPDVAKLYYLLHYRYPSLEKLFEFVCRAAAGFGWVTQRGQKVADLGFEGPSPKEFSDALKARGVEGVKDAMKYLILYAKWWDYAPFSWVENFPPDRAIMMDLMADIPTRIDARWMYKWGVISDKELFRIVLARGMHPDWVKNITIGEAMNALAEERTYARTGVVALASRGYITMDKLKSILGNLTTIKILDEDVVVRFLPGEIELLKLRAEYDKVRRLMDAITREVTLSYYQNVMTTDDAINAIKKFAEGLAPKVVLDETYVRKLLEAYKVRWEREIIMRLRRWMWVFVWRTTQMAEAGYSVDDILAEYAEKAKLTDTELEFMKELAHMFVNIYKRERKIRAIINRLRRGVITPDEAVRELTELDIPEDIAQAIVEGEAKPYVLSIATLLSYAEVIHVPEDLLKRKLDALGVPDDEKELVLQVFRVRPIRDERARVIRRILDDFEEGYLTEDEAKERFKAYDLKDVEIDLLITAGKMYREGRIKKYMVDAVLDKLRRGAISVEEAKEALKKIIKDEKLIDAMIIKSARAYVATVERLVSMREYVPVPDEMFNKKLELMGVPEDEAKLYPAYAVARELSEEIMAYVRELGNWYVEGLLTDDEFKRELDGVATLWGQAKRVLGVEWVVLSPTERQFLFTIYQMRKARRELVRSRRGS